MQAILETERLLLRPLQLEDAIFIIELFNSPGWLKYIGDRKITHKVTAQKYINSLLENPAFNYTVFILKTTKKPMGIVSLIQRKEESHPDIGFSILPQFSGKGYTFEASHAFLKAHCNKEKHENIIAFTKPTNAKSIQLLKKLGLQYTGNFQKNDELLSYFSLK